jgi:hypothetical protein
MLHSHKPHKFLMSVAPGASGHALPLSPHTMPPCWTQHSGLRNARPGGRTAPTHHTEMPLGHKGRYWGTGEVLLPLRPENLPWSTPGATIDGQAGHRCHPPQSAMSPRG